MLELLIVIGRALALAFRGHWELVLESLALRQQLMRTIRGHRLEHLPRIEDRSVLGCLGLS